MTICIVSLASSLYKLLNNGVNADNLEMADNTKYFGVYIPKDSNESDKPDDKTIHVYSNYDQAAVILKENKNSRFKIFTSKDEACHFSRYGSIGGQGNPNVVSESTTFKSLKRPEVYKFRKHIENDDYTSVETMIWENPRYLISIGDTPTIMQEGARYNALHIAAKHKRARIAQLILSTVSNPSFTKLLYGVNDEKSYIVRPELLVDLYLNTPDKSLNETPLHFAAKYGAADVVAVLIQYPQLKMEVKNKYNQTPRDITAKYVARCKDDVAEQIHKMLNELFYVPVWRSNDDIVQPIVGKPYSPKSPPVCPGLSSPVSPSMEIKAVAGPMTYDEATNFHKSWKSPVRSVTCTSPGTPHLSQGVLMRNPLEMERGLEKVGRTLAMQFHVSWKEYWPFLDKFIDLRSEDGLRMLEEYLKQKINSEKPTLNQNEDVLSPMSELCHEFSKCSINSPNFPENDLSNSTIDFNSAGDAAKSPYLLIENLCVTFAGGVMDTFLKHFADNMPIEDNVVALIKRVRSLISSLDGCRKDIIFKFFPFEKIHVRIAQWISRKLMKLEERQLSYATATFKLIDQTDANNMLKRITLSPTSKSIELEHIVHTLKCINGHVITLLGALVSSSERAQDETTCKKEWSDVGTCQCANKDNFLSRGYRLGQVLRKLIIFSDENESTEIDKNSNVIVNKSPKPTSTVERLKDPNQKVHVTINSEINCDNETALSNEKICDKTNFDSDDEDDEFFTPSGSVSGSDDEMNSPDEGPEIYITDDKGTSVDNAVLEALADVTIDRDIYPSIYRWKHSILLHNTIDRLSWPSPKSSKMIKKKNTLRGI